MGRPTSNPRTVSLHLRISEKEAELIKECSDVLKIPKTDVIIRGVQKVYKEAKKE
jgi:hypothetical protein